MGRQIAQPDAQTQKVKRLNGPRGGKAKKATHPSLPYNTAHRYPRGAILIRRTAVIRHSLALNAAQHSQGQVNRRHATHIVPVLDALDSRHFLVYNNTQRQCFPRDSFSA